MQCFTHHKHQLIMDDHKSDTFHMQTPVMANSSSSSTTSSVNQQTSSVTPPTSASSTPTISSSISASSANNKTPLSSSSSTAPLSILPNSTVGPSGETPCCDSGRLILADPLTGQTVCSCQYDPSSATASQQQQQAQQQLLNYQRLAAASSHALPINMYGTVPYPSDQAYLPVGAALSEQSAFYPPTENFGTWPYPASMYYPYDPSFAYSYANGYVMDVNGVRQKPKNATRETTSTLKAWLSEHRKNPYPTKGEKIMLAIITRMTLTQVSTWFANARRRLKKENKMTWEPRNRVDDDDDHEDMGNTGSGQNSDKGAKSNENGFDSNSCPRSISVDPISGLGSNIGGDVRREDMSLSLGTMSEGISQRDSLSSPTSSIMSDSRSSIQSPCLNESSESTHGTLYPHPAHHHMLSPQLHGEPGHPGHHPSGALKPRIWSIVDTATSNNAPPVNNPVLNNNFMHGLGVSGGLYPSVNSLSPGSKMSSQFMKNLRFGYASPYAKTHWTSDVNALNSSMPGDPNPSASPSSSLSSSSTPSSSISTPPCHPNINQQSLNINNNNNALKPVINSSSSAMLMANKRPNVNVTGFNSNAVPSTSLSMTTASTTSTTGSYPMSSIAAAAAAAAYNNNTMNTALLGRAYAQTIQNLSNLTKGLLMTGATGTQLTGTSSANSFIGSVKTSPSPGSLQSDQRSEMQSSTS